MHYLHTCTYRAFRYLSQISGSLNFICHFTSQHPPTTAATCPSLCSLSDVPFCHNIWGNYGSGEVSTMCLLTAKIVVRIVSPHNSLNWWLCYISYRDLYTCDQWSMFDKLLTATTLFFNSESPLVLPVLGLLRMD